MPERIRQTRWKTSDGMYFDTRELAVHREKVIVLGAAICEAILAKHGDSASVDYCEDIASAVIENKRGIVIALIPVKERK
jgi:hypothetical protein